MEEASFPRGHRQRAEKKNDEHTDKKSRTNKTSSKEKKRPATDFLFGSAADDTKAKRAPKKAKNSSIATSTSIPKSDPASKKSLLPLGGGAVVVPQKGDPYIEALSFSKFAKDFSLLAFVKEVHEDLAIFSLPNQWTGFMLRTDKDPVTYDKALIKGQILSVRVVKAVQEQTQTGPRRRIQVTCDPAKVNPKDASINSTGVFVRGQVLSVEDHGLLIDLGLKRRGFLPFDEIGGSYIVDEDSGPFNEESRFLSEGRIEDFLVRGGGSGDLKIVPLSLPAKVDVAKHFLPASSTPTLQTLQPGSLVRATVETVVRNGLCVTFAGGIFRGAVEVQHLGTLWIPNGRQESDHWKPIFNQNRSVVARIIAVDAATKIIRLSMLPHLLDLRVPVPLPAVGSVIPEATVIRLDSGVGALLALPNLVNESSVEKKNRIHSPVSKDESYTEASRVQAVYVHISKAIDHAVGKTSEAVFAKLFAPSTKHSVRILSTANMIEGIASGATAEGIVSAHVLTHGDLIPGRIYKQVPVCAQLDGGGILVDFGMGIRGMIPPMQLFDQAATSDYRTKMRKVKYAIGAKVDVRVLTVDQDTKKCMLTAKKSLLKAEHIITSYDSLKIGQKGSGFVSKIDERGLSVTFFNGVYGVVNARSLRTELGIEDHSNSYHLGDVVSGRVVNLKRRQVNNANRLDQDEAESGQSKARVYWEMTFSLKGLEEKDIELEDTMEQNDAYKMIHLRAGAILPLRSVRVLELITGKEKDRGYVPGHAIVSIKSKYVVGESDCASMLPMIECKLPYDQLLDNYELEDIESAAALDALASKLLTVGKKINRKGLVLRDPRKSKSEYFSGTGSLAVISIRPTLVETIEAEASRKEESDDIFVPSPNSHLYVGATLQGYVAQIDNRHGAFVQFLDGLTGMVPKKKGGLLLPLFSTIISNVVAVDTMSSPKRILLSVGRKLRQIAKNVEISMKIGDIIEEAEVKTVDFYRASLKLEGVYGVDQIKARLHCTMVDTTPAREPKTIPSKMRVGNEITKGHPFFGWKAGKKVQQLRVVAIETESKFAYVELSTRSPFFPDAHGISVPTYFQEAHQLTVGTKVSGIVSAVCERSSGLWVMLSPGLSGFVPAFELSDNPHVLNNLKLAFPRGSCLECVVNGVESGQNGKVKGPVLSVLGVRDLYKKPEKGDLVVARVHRSKMAPRPPALMLGLREGCFVRVCISELDEVDDWINLPLGNNLAETGRSKSDSIDNPGLDEQCNDGVNDGSVAGRQKSLADRAFVSCRILSTPSSEKGPFEGSLRYSRIEGDLDDDDPPDVGDTVQAFVIDTNSKGCFVRLSRRVQGRAMLKELCDGFLPDPAAAFPMGRLVVGKVKQIKPASSSENSFVVDVDMRESSLLDRKTQLCFDQVEIGSKYKGTVTRIEDYGVFVRLEGSEVSGLVHKSECSDKYVKTLSAFYDPGDLVKVLVLKKDEQKKTLGFSMKSSHFEDDEDSDVESIDEVSGIDHSDDNDSFDNQSIANIAAGRVADEAESGSDDESEGSVESSESGSDEEKHVSSDSSNKPAKKSFADILDMNVGFDWNGTRSMQSHTRDQDSVDEDDSSEDEANEDELHKLNHKSRRKQAQRRQEEQDIARREIALADGTANDNPETASDFERLLASSPNSSELWIRYMAFHLTLADIPAAREVAERAFQRIEFRQEGEKLNVWCALLTLELKYGSSTCLKATIERACQHNNPKKIHLRVCEMMEKEVTEKSSVGTTERTDDMFSKMCKKFKSKKTVWLAHAKYLLRLGRHEEAYALSKRALLSLPAYKHVELMSKFAQLVFEYNSAEKARTLFDGLLQKNPKRLDILFVYVDKEVKYGEAETARSLFEKVAGKEIDSLQMKLSDKQMKSLFKKWFSFEEQHGTAKTQERVKEAARAYVESSS